MADLRELIDAFTVAKAAYDASAGRGDCDGPEWDVYEATEHAVIVYPCRTVEDVRLKAHFFLDNDGPNDTLRNCFTGDHDWTLDLFLRSLTGEAQP